MSKNPAKINVVLLIHKLDCGNGKGRGEGGQGSAFAEDEEAVEGGVEEDLADAALGRWLQLWGSNSR